MQELVFSSEENAKGGDLRPQNTQAQDLLYNIAAAQKLLGWVFVDFRWQGILQFLEGKASGQCHRMAVS